MTQLRSFPSIYAVGHRSAALLFSAPVEVTEKVDGSFWGMGILDDKLVMRSKSQEVHVDTAGMFDLAVQTATQLDLHPGWSYYGEYLRKPKHNTLAYDRAPRGHVILFGIDRGDQDFMGHADMVDEAQRLGLETVPLIFDGMAEATEWEGWLDRTSVLGGQQIEGFVVRSQSLLDDQHKALHAKYVSERFKETHSKEWKVANPTKANVVERIIATLCTTARWDKAVQHLRDRGLLENVPQDIPLVLREIVTDTLAEEDDWIRTQLYEWCVKDIKRGIVRGAPDWYKQRLVEEAFGQAA